MKDIPFVFLQNFLTFAKPKPTPMYEGFFRVAAASPSVVVADTATNCCNIISLMKQADEAGADLVVFPEMCITGYTCADLFHSETLLQGASKGLEDIASASAKFPGLVAVVGLPVRRGARLYNCAAVVAQGAVKALVPKTYIPNYNEFYERRWFDAAPQAPVEAAFGTDILIEHRGVKIGIEICEDLWTPVPPSCHHALAGAEVILNLSASDDLIGKYNYLLDLVRQQSARCICAYAYASAGFGESSTDLVFDAKLVVAENGSLMARNKRWTRGNQIVMCDVDIRAIRRDRMHIGTFADCAARENSNQASVVVIPEKAARRSSDFKLMRHIDPMPFVPAADELLNERCEEIVHIQTSGLAQRLAATHTKNLVIGISGGLDSTLALLLAVRTFDSLGLDRKGITGVTMPGFGTTGRTHTNAVTLMEALGITTREISIVPAVNQHFSDIGHDPSNHDVTYENSQARQRTYLLMDIANQVGGMVLGTGDLSELALGWATYNGDHMSMYGINAGVPKTLVRHLTAYFARLTSDEPTRKALLDIIDTPISPELIPANADGTIHQKTEDLVGPYELHDFFLYYTLRYGFTPRRVFLMARHAFEAKYDTKTLKHWMRTFYRRFFNQQFKRSCMPDGPKVGSVCLSPRGDWRMPSDASSALWLKEVDEL